MNYWDEHGDIPAAIAAVGAYVGAHGVLGAVVGGATGAVGGFVFSCEGAKNKLKGTFAGLTAGAAGGALGGIGSALSTDFLGPASVGGDFVSGVLSTKASFALGDALSGSCPSDEQKEVRDRLSELTGLAAMLSPSDTLDAIFVGAGSGLAAGFVDGMTGIVTQP